MDKEKLAKIREIKITTVLGIKDTGRRISMRCPLHDDRTASFYIYPDNSWCCYGCNKTGQNAIDLLMEMGASFNESIEELSKYS